MLSAIKNVPNVTTSAIVNAYHSINFKLLLVLILTSIVPLIYSTTRIHFLGEVPHPWAFSIAAQVAWLNVVYEVLSEALLLPLAFVLGQAIHSPKQYNVRVSTGLAIVVLAYICVTTAVVVFAPQLVTMMHQQTSLITKTVSYIRLESIGILVSSVFAFSSLVLVLKNKLKLIYLLLVIQTLLTLLGDSLLVSQLPFSLTLGVNGIAWTNIAVNTVLSGIAIKYLLSKGVSIRRVHFIQQSWLITWLRVGAKSGLESFVRNTAFIVMILQLVNQVQQAGVYWLTNQFIWGWLLLPVLAVGQLVKIDAANHGGLSQQKIHSYMLLILVIVFCWLGSITGWQSFIAEVMGVPQAQMVTQLALLMLGFYIVFAFNHVIDSYFYGIGRTDLMLYQSLLVNTCYYGSAYIAYQQGWYVPSLHNIALMFGIGITLDAIITIWLYYRLCQTNRTQHHC